MCAYDHATCEIIVASYTYHFSMKTSLLSRHRSHQVMACIWCCLTLTSALQAEMREFKNAAGVAIKAELKKVKGQMIFLKNEAGKEIQIPLLSFSKEDQDYVLKWITEDPTALDYNFVCKAEEKLVPASKTSGNSYYERVASVQKNYAVNVLNSCRNPMEDLSVDWCAFMLNRVTISSTGGYSFSMSSANPLGQLHVKHGTESVAKLEASHAHAFNTPAFAIDSVTDKYYTGAKRKDQLQGVWLRFYRGDTMVGEWKSPDCPKTTWPGPKHVVKAPKVKTDDKKTDPKPAAPAEPAPTEPDKKEDDMGDLVKIFEIDDKK
jgi:hypothetical protein